MPLVKNNNLLLVLIAVIAAIVFVPFIGNCHLFDWDEVNFAECAREMLVSGNYSRVQLNYQPFWEKPPFFIWLQAISMNLFGVNEFAARFPNAVCSIFSSVTLFYIGKKYHSNKFGIIWALLYVSSLLPHVYFKSGIIDPWFNLFIFGSIYQCFLFLNQNPNNKRFLQACLAGLFLGLAVLTKGPAAIVIVALTILVFVIWNKQWRSLFTLPFFLFVFITLFVSGSWFMIEWLKGNEHIIQEFIDYQIRLFQTEDSGHSGPVYYHILVLLFGCFPASFIFLAAYLKHSQLESHQKTYRRMMLSLFWVVLVIFSIVKTKILHYSSLCYYPLTFVAAIGLVQFPKELKLNYLASFFYFFITLLISSAFVAISYIEAFKSKIIDSGIIKDDFAIQNLSANVHWSGFEFLIGLLFLTGSLLIYMAIKKQKLHFFYQGAAFNIVFLFTAILLIAPKIEGYTQGAAVEFYKSCAYQNCYIETRGFKSYAYLFYSQRKPNDYTNPVQKQEIVKTLDYLEKEGHSRVKSYAMANLLWLENGEIDRMAYFVSKTIDEKTVLTNKNIVKLYNRNGYSFYARLPTKTAK